MPATAAASVPTRDAPTASLTLVRTVPAPGERTAARPRLRRFPFPLAGPPLLGSPGEVTSIVGHVGEGQGVLPLELPARGRGSGEVAFAGPQPTGSADLPDAAAWSRRYLLVLLDVLAGQRPPQQLLRWCAPDVYVGVQRRAQLAARVRQRTGAAHRAPVVQSVHACVPADGVVEVAAVVRDGSRVRASALRLEGWDRRWRVTVLEMG